MNPPAQKVLEDALRLPNSERADLAASLIDSLDPKFDENAQSAWDAEIQRRVVELSSGSVKPIPWPEARRRILNTPDESANA